MKSKKPGSNLLSLLLILFSLAVIVVITDEAAMLKKRIASAQVGGYKQSQQQGTFDLITPTPTITPVPLPTVPGTTPTGPLPTVNPAASIPGAPLTPGPLPTGGAASPSDPFYCIDDEDPDGCDDNTAFHVPKGTGGASGTCGTIMENGHKVVASLPQELKGMRDRLNPAVSNSCHNTGTYSSGYLSTYFVIDTFNLTGYKELSKTNASHVTGTGMLNWWKTQPPGYTFVPYTPTTLQQHASGQNNLTGCVVFINMGSGSVHVGIFNVLQLVNGNGDGVLSILQSGARFYIDRFPVAGWDVKNTPLHQTQISGIAGFGCHT